MHKRANKRLALLALGLTLAITAARGLPQLPMPQALATTPKILTLKDAILLAMRSDPNVRSALLDRITDKFALEVAHNQFELQYSLTGSATYTQNTKPSYTVSPGVTYETPIGTELGATINSTYDGTTTSSLTLTATQPLLQGFGTEVTEADLRNAIDQEKINRLTLRDTISGEITTIIGDYYTIVKDLNQLKVQNLGYVNAKQTLINTKLKVKAGRDARSEIIQQEAQVAKLAPGINTAKNQVAQDYQTLLTALGLDPNSKLKINTTISLGKVSSPNLQKSIAIALANNTDYQNALVTLKTDKRALVVAKDKKRWQLDLKLSDTMDVDGDKGIPTLSPLGNNGSPDSLPSTDNKSAELDLTIPIDDVASKQGVVDAKITLEQQKITVANQKRTLISNVTQGIENLKSDIEQIKLDETSVKLAQINYNNTQLKLNNGLATGLDLTQVQDDLISAQISLINDKIAYLNEVATFNENLGLTLQHWGLHIQY